MELQIDFNYTIKYKPFRAINDRYATGASSVNVSIKEVSVKDAPLVARVGQNNAHRHLSTDAERFATKKGGALREIRMFGGMHYVELKDVDTFKGMIQGEDFRRTLFKQVNLRVEPEAAQRVKLTTPERLAAAELKPVREMDYDAEKNQAIRIQQVADHMIIVDGTVFEYTPQPILYLNSNGYRESCYIGARPHSPILNDDPYGLFTMLRSSVYGKFYTESLPDAHLLVDALDVNHAPTIEIIDPYAFCYDGTTHDTMYTVKQCISEMASTAATLPANFLELYYDLNSEYLALSEEYVSQSLLNILNNLSNGSINQDFEFERYMAHIVQNHNMIFAGERWLTERVGSFKSLADGALHRWALRPPGRHWNADVCDVAPLKAFNKHTWEFFSEGVAGDYVTALDGSLKDVKKAVERGERIIGSEVDGNIVVLSIDQIGNLKLIAGSNIELNNDHIKEYLLHSMNSKNQSMQGDERNISIGDFSI